MRQYKSNYWKVSLNPYTEGTSRKSCRCSECGATVPYDSGQVYEDKLYGNRICLGCYQTLEDEPVSLEKVGPRDGNDVPAEPTPSFDEQSLGSKCLSLVGCLVVFVAMAALVIGAFYIGAHHAY